MAVPRPELIADRSTMEAFVKSLLVLHGRETILPLRHRSLLDTEPAAGDLLRGRFVERLPVPGLTSLKRVLEQQSA